MKVILYGHLKRQFGSDFTFDVNSPSEAIRALNANFSTFTKELTEWGEYYLFFDDTPVTDIDHLTYFHHKKDMEFSIIPVIQGGIGNTGKQFLTIFTGIALAIASVFTLNVSGFIGAATLIGTGIYYLVNPPKEAEAEKTPKRLNGAFFDGAVNTIGNKHRAPIGYGEMITGSHCISVGVETKES